MTNYEYITGLSIDEMAEEMQGECCFCKLTEQQNCDNASCKQGIKQWLESEAEQCLSNIGTACR